MTSRVWLNGEFCMKPWTQMVPPFGHKAIHSKVNLILHGYKMNMMTHGLEKQSPSLPLGIDVQTVYATLTDGSNRVTVVLRNNTRDWLEIKKGMPIARIGDEVSEPELEFSDSVPEGTYSCSYSASGIDSL